MPPVAVFCVGMAGSGKTTLMQRLASDLHAASRRPPAPTSTSTASASSAPSAPSTFTPLQPPQSSPPPPYVLNLDPAVYSLPFDANVDIRDSIDYKEVMRQYHLGPNGGILTALNLFATKVDQVVGILERRVWPGGVPFRGQEQGPGQTEGQAQAQEGEAGAKETQGQSQGQGQGKGKGKGQGEAARPAIDHILVDTPGQIEAFVWSASGSILLEAVASSFPTVIAYVVDTARTTTSTGTFMSNMLYACSILYKTKLPVVLVFNKTDVPGPGVAGAATARSWMADFEAFQHALAADEARGTWGGDAGAAGMLAGSGYMGSFLNSMSLMLDEFYRHLSVVAVSARTGEGIPELLRAFADKEAEFVRDYQPELERRRIERERLTEKRREVELGRLMRDMSVGRDRKDELGEQEEDDDNDDAEDDLDEDPSLEERYKQALGESDEQGLGAKYLHNRQLS